LAAVAASEARSEPKASGVVETGLFLDGLRCASCVNRVERELRAAPGVAEAAVSYANHRAWVRFDPRATSPEALVARVEALGFSATPYDPNALERPAAAQSRAALVRLLVAAFLAMNVMWLAIALYLGALEDMDAEVRRTLRWVVIALSVPSVVWCAAPFWRGAWKGLSRRELTLDVPVVLGVATAFAANVVGTVAEAPELYVDSAAVIVFLVLLGKTLEQRARGRASAAVDALAALAPETALRRTAQGVERVPLAELAAGDRVVVPAGERVPADGRLLEGAAELDESPFTGEARPALRRAGETLCGGARNLLAEIELELVARPAEGTLGRMVALLERAQAEKPRIQRRVDRVAAVFAPAVLAVAAATAFGRLALGAAPLDAALAAAAVLLVACPCALGLATPAAITAALGRAAGLGILVKRGEALERCGAVKRAVLDKTGTLTAGRFELREALPAPGVARAELLAAAAEAEGEATHPIAAALRRAAPEVKPGPAPRKVAPGRGVVAGEGAEALRAGSAAWLAECGVPLPAALAEAAGDFARRGHTLVWVARGGRALGVLALWDPPRPDAAAAVAKLRRLGVAVELVTGDHAGAAALAAEAAGIDEVLAAASPEAKVERIRAARARGESTLALGDGVNDAAALGAADLGVAMAAGSDVTLHAADAVISAPRLGAAADLVELSRATGARIRENLALAVAYNAVAVPLAIAGILGPLSAAIAMSLSSLAVTGNAIRLLRFQASP
jgi:heavy metal translocating P-type ATPase